MLGARNEPSVQLSLAVVMIGPHGTSAAFLLGLVSMAVAEAELETVTLRLAQEIASRHPAALANAKIAVQMGRDLSLPQAMRLDQLVGARQRLMVDPLGQVGEYLSSQKGGPNAGYRRTDPK